MRKIKKYANRKLYDTTAKKYVSMDRLSDLIKSGEEVMIQDNETGKDITSSVVSQILAREKTKDDEGVPSGVLIQILRKGGGTVVSYARRYTAIWQSAITMAEDEVDKLVNLLVKDKEISESEGSKLKKEIKSYADNFKHWIGEKIDQRIDEALSLMNLATKDQIKSLTVKIETLTEKVEKLEKIHAKPSSSHGKTHKSKKK